MVSLFSFFTKKWDKGGGQCMSFEPEVGKDGKPIPFQHTWRDCEAWDHIYARYLAKGEEDVTDVTSATMSASFLNDSSSGARQRYSGEGLAIVRRKEEATGHTKSKQTKTNLKKKGSSKATKFLWGNHSLVNANRKLEDNRLEALKRSQELDELARWHAQAMAAESRVFHSDPKELCAKLSQEPERRLGENVYKGKSTDSIQTRLMNHHSSFANVIDDRYVEMGMATAKDKKGTIYLCQLFRG
ncbi:expressed unknown protein [Seminavis robusta]|uniref:SCP domain-containing protein n=1 Tax=Seminavis robusta TaxID=568900 RepID=A0A9N8E0K2_9STRA|nr:expressed unknown protein [Seminavis robusta]|eukprot:Sro526_g160270.1 n/a (243) ;mRNA; f:5880-6608